MKWHSLTADEIGIIINLFLSGRGNSEIANLLGISETQVAWLLDKKSHNRLCHRECLEIKRRLDWFLGGDSLE